jgi:hypothetical protein
MVIQVGVQNIKWADTGRMPVLCHGQQSCLDAASLFLYGWSQVHSPHTHAYILRKMMFCQTYTHTWLFSFLQLYNT